MSRSVAAGEPAQAPGVFDGPGEARALARALDWGATALGPPAAWPEALRVAARMCMDSPSAIALWAGGDFTLVHNDAYVPFLGVKARWAMGRPAREVWPEIWDDLGPELARVYAGGEPTRHEDAPYTIRRHGDDETGHFTFTLSPVRDAAGRVVAVLNVSQETTSAVQAASRLDAALRESEARLRDANERFTMAIESSPVVVFTQDADLRYTWIANAGLGYRGEEVLGRTDGEILERREDAERLDALKRRALSTGESVRATCPVQRAGATRWFDVHVRPQRAGGAIVGILATAVDVTESREAEDRVTTREAHLRLAMEASLAVAFEWDVVRDRVVRVQSAEEALPSGGEGARTLQEVAGVVHPDDRELFLANVRAALLAPDGRYHSEFRIVRPSGEVRWLSESGRVEIDPGGAPLRLIGISIDVTERNTAAEALRASEERFRELADAMPQLVWTATSDGAVEYYNRRRGEFAVPAAPGPANDWAALVHPEDMPATSEAWRRAAAAGVTYEMAHRLRRADGTYGWFLSRAVPARDARGRIVRWYGTATDIDAQRAAEEERRRYDGLFRTVAEANLIGVGFGDLSGRVTYVNDEMLRMMGRSRAEVEAGGVDLEACLAPECLAEHRRTADVLRRDGVAVGYEKAFLRPDGTRTPFLGAAAIVDAATGFHVSIALDLTRQKAAERDLERADRQKTEFLAVLSHELRNPLAPIRNSILLLDRADPASAAARRAKDILRRQVDQLARLVDDLLDLSRITYGKLHVVLAPADARELARRAHADAKVLFDERDVELSLEDGAEPLWIEADPPRFAQMVGNLLHNALKFTGPGGHVQLEVARKGAACEIAVKDDGLGLCGADLERIFDPFEQGTRAPGAAGGLGLGLALVKQIAEKHHGAVRARSDGPGKGAEFVIELPLADRATGGASDGSVRGGGPPPMRIVVVEDNEDAAATLADLLSLGGHAVTVAGTGAEGVRAVAAGAPDVLICDIGLPDMSGYDVVRAVRASERGGRVFAVALTGYAQPQDRDEALAAGFDAHLAKPPPLDELEVLLRKAAARG